MCATQIPSKLQGAFRDPDWGLCPLTTLGLNPRTPYMFALCVCVLRFFENLRQP